MTTRPCGSRNLYCFLHRLSAVPPFYTDSPRSVHPKQWGLSQNTRKASPDNHRNSFSSWCGSNHKCGRHHHPYTATRILFLLFSCIRRIPAEKKHTPRKPHRREKAQQNHLPEPPLALHRIGIPGIYKVFHGTIKIQLAAVKVQPRNRHSSA